MEFPIYLTLDYFDRQKIFESNCRVLRQKEGLYQYLCKGELKGQVEVAPNTFSRKTYFILCIPYDMLGQPRKMSLSDSMYKRSFVLFSKCYGAELGYCFPAQSMGFFLFKFIPMEEPPKSLYA